MAVNDPIADMLNRIRNAVRTRKKTVVCLNNRVCRGILQVLQDEGYITGYELVEAPTSKVTGGTAGGGTQGTIFVKLKYGPRGESLINDLRRESTPGRRLYSKAADLRAPVQGLGISIVSTSQGVLSDRAARAKGVGGELLATVL